MQKSIKAKGQFCEKLKKLSEELNKLNFLKKKIEKKSFWKEFGIQFMKIYAAHNVFFEQTEVKKRIIYSTV